MSPGELVLAARGGDRKAFAELYRRHARMVHGVLLARLPKPELRDAMQEVFVVALAKLADLREPESVSPWLASIARNLARDWHKRARELSSEPVALDDRRGQARDLDDALQLLAAIHELALGMTPGSVRVKLHRAMTTLREQLNAGSADGKNEGGRP